MIEVAANIGRTGDWKLYILLYLAASGHNNYTTSLVMCLHIIQNY